MIFGYKHDILPFSSLKMLLFFTEGLGLKTLTRYIHTLVKYNFSKEQNFALRDTINSKRYTEQTCACIKIGFQFHTPSEKENILSETKICKHHAFRQKSQFFGIFKKSM